MQITTTTEESGIRLSPSGRLDAMSMKQFEDCVEPYLAEGTNPVTLDFSELSYISSCGLRIIMNAVKKLNLQGRKLTIRNAQPNVYEIFVLTGFQNFIDISQKMD